MQFEEIADPEMCELDVLPGIPLFTSLGLCFMCSLLVLGGLFLWNTKDNWDEITMLQRRVIGLAMLMLMAAYLIYASPLVPKFMGKRLKGLWQVIPLPYGLTAIMLLLPMLANMQNTMLIHLPLH